MQPPARNAIFACMLALVCSAQARAETATVYCLPMGVETYSAITRERVRATASGTWTINSAQQIADLTALLKQGQVAKFSDWRVRYAIDIGTVSYYIDAEGIVQTAGEPDRRIDAASLPRCDAALLAHRKWLETHFQAR